MVFSIQQKLIIVCLSVVDISVNISSQTTLSEISNAEVDRINSHQPRFKKPFGTIITEESAKPENANESNYDRPKPKSDQYYCDLDDQNNFQTAVTFYGDSRLDLIDSPFYGYANLDAYLGASKEAGWNVQNLANSGLTSLDLIKHLSLCYRAKFPFSQITETDVTKLSNPDGSDDFTRMMFPRYVTSKNIVFEIGGNDFIQKIPEFIYAPWLMPNRVENVRITIRDIISLLRRRDRNVLLIGNYPPISSSLSLGSAQKQVDALKNFRGLYAELSPHSLASNRQFTLPEIGLFHEQIQKTFYEYFNKGLSEGTADIDPKDIFQPITDRFKKVTSVSTYQGWITFNIQEGGFFTTASIAMMLLETQLEKTVNETKTLPFIDTSISSAHYHTVWEIFIDPRVRNTEPWVGNPLLTAYDFIHPNAMGFKLWSDSVSRKIRSLNWHKNPKQFRRGELRDYDALNIPILDILKQNRARLNSALDQINTTYSNLFEENARLQIALRKVIIQGRLDKNDAAILLEIDRLEKERLRLLAEAEAKRLEAIRIAEEQRLAEEAAIAAAAAWTTP